MVGVFRIKVYIVPCPKVFIEHLLPLISSKEKGGSLLGTFNNFEGDMAGYGKCESVARGRNKNCAKMR